MSTTAPTAAPAVFSTRNKVGLVLAFLLGLADIAFLAVPTGEGEAGPPIVVLAVGALCGLVTMVAVGVGWSRGSQTAVRVAAGSRVLSVLLMVPAFFVDDVPAGLVAGTSFIVLLHLVALVLLLTPARKAPAA